MDPLSTRNSIMHGILSDGHTICVGGSSIGGE